MPAVRTRTVEKSEVCHKDIKHFIKYARKACADARWFDDLGDRQDKLYHSFSPEVTITKHRDEIRFQLYVNASNQGKTMQSYDM